MIPFLLACNVSLLVMIPLINYDPLLTKQPSSADTLEIADENKNERSDVAMKAFDVV